MQSNIILMTPFRAIAPKTVRVTRAPFRLHSANRGRRTARNAPLCGTYTEVRSRNNLPHSGSSIQMIRGLRHSCARNVVINHESEQSARGIMWTTLREICMKFAASFERRKKRKESRRVSAGTRDSRNFRIHRCALCTSAYKRRVVEMRVCREIPKRES